MKSMKTFFVYLGRNPMFALVNTLGLAVALTFVILLGTMVSGQLTTDDFHERSDRIFTIGNEAWNGNGYAVAEMLKAQFPEIEEVCNVKAYPVNVSLGSDADGSASIATMADMLLVGRHFFDIFTFDIVAGNATDPLATNDGVVISESYARRMFGDKDPVGQRLLFRGIDSSQPDGNKMMTVVAVMRDMGNTVLRGSSSGTGGAGREIIAPFEAFPGLSPDYIMQGDASYSVLFALQREGADLAARAGDMEKFLRDNQYWIYSKNVVKEVRVTPLRDLYFDMRGSNGVLDHGDKGRVIILVVAGLVILFMAVFNYVNLNVAQTSWRMREMATRQLLGETKASIFARQITECLIVTAAAFVLALIAAKACEESIGQLLGWRIDLVGSVDATSCVVCLAAVAVIGFVSGAFPAGILASCDPLEVVRGSFRRRTKAVWSRVLNVVQNGISMALIATALFVTALVSTIMRQPLGYEWDNVLVCPTFDSMDKCQLFKSRVEQLPFVTAVGFSCGTPLDGGTNNHFNNPNGGRLRMSDSQLITCDTATMGIFGIRPDIDYHVQPQFDMRTSTYFVTPAILDTIGLGDDAREYYIGQDISSSFRIIIAGVLPELHLGNALSTMPPLTLCVKRPENFYPWHIIVKTTGGDPEGQRAAIEEIRMDITDIEGDLAWYDDQMRDSYAQYADLRTLLVIFSAVALSISLAGSVAMSTYMVQQRRKDMAIRKVFGSTNRLEMRRFLGSAAVSVLLGAVLSIPLLWVAVRQVRRVIDFDIAFPVWTAAVAIGFVAVVSLCSSLLVASRAVNENPVNSLKNE